MRLIEVLERQTGYLIFNCFNRVTFYKVQCAVFANCFPSLFYTSTHFSRLFPGREMPLQNSRLFPGREMPLQNSRLFPIVGTLLSPLSLQNPGQVPRSNGFRYSILRYLCPTKSSSFEKF